MQCECHTGKCTVIARIKSILIGINLLTSGFLQIFGSYSQFPGGMPVLTSPADARGLDLSLELITTWKTLVQLVLMSKSRWARPPLLTPMSVSNVQNKALVFEAFKVHIVLISMSSNLC